MLTDDLRRHAGRYYGKYRGKVVGVTDAHHQGSLTVTVPAVFGETAQVVARACMPYGHFFVPPVGADVWVEFEAGDPLYPLWVGAWYPEGTAPADAQVTPPNRRVIHTPAGHTILIDDTSGDERILIRHKTDAFMSIDKSGTVLVSNAKGSHLNLDAEHDAATLVEQHGNHLAMGASGVAIVNPQGTTVNVTGDTVHVSAGKIILQGTSVALGGGASDPTIMGTAFNILWTAMLAHVHPTGVGPSGPSPVLAPLALQPGVHLTSSVTVK